VRVQKCLVVRGWDRHSHLMFGKVEVGDTLVFLEGLDLLRVAGVDRELEWLRELIDILRSDSTGHRDDSFAGDVFCVGDRVHLKELLLVHGLENLVDVRPVIA
jgi:hypothetical protein